MNSLKRLEYDDEGARSEGAVVMAREGVMDTSCASSLKGLNGVAVISAELTVRIGVEISDCCVVDSPDSLKKMEAPCTVVVPGSGGVTSGVGVPMNITVSGNTLSSADGDESGKDVRMTGGVDILAAPCSIVATNCRLLGVWTEKSSAETASSVVGWKVISTCSWEVDNTGLLYRCGEDGNNSTLPVDSG